MKHILSVDVCKTDDGYSFTLHHMRCATTFKVKSLNEGFKKIEEIVNSKKNADEMKMDINL